MLQFDNQEMYNAYLELMIKILANQRTLITLFAEKMGTTEDEINSIIYDANEQSAHYAKEVYQGLYERRGKIDLDDLLK